MEYPTYLIHYGIPGQKWGVRRFQNEDGTYTDEGLERRRVDSSKLPHYGGKGIKGPLGHEEWKKIDLNKDFVIKKGSMYERVSTKEKEKFKERTYVSGMSSDQYAEWLVDINKNYYIDKLETKRDVVIAGEKTVRDILKTIGNENANKVLKAMDVNHYEDKPEITDYLPNGSKRYEKYIDFLNKDNLGIQKPFIKELRKRGYDGLLDPLDGHYYPGFGLDKDATIYVKNVLKRVGQTKYERIDGKLKITKK